MLECELHRSLVHPSPASPLSVLEQRVELAFGRTEEPLISSCEEVEEAVGVLGRVTGHATATDSWGGVTGPRMTGPTIDTSDRYDFRVSVIAMVEKKFDEPRTCLHPHEDLDRC